MRGRKIIFDIKDVERLFCYTEEELLTAARHHLEVVLKYKNISVGKMFLYAPGTIPILLVAHVDTVFKKPLGVIYHDQQHDVLWSPDGLGADDRAGVLIIFELLRRGLRPHVLLLDGEESGGQGARKVVKKLIVPEIKYILELDRRGEKDAVFYDCDNKAFVEYVESFGFTEAAGTFTDISILCPAWGIAGVNISCGYYSEHSRAEYFKMREAWEICGKIERMLQHSPKQTYEYIPTPLPEYESIWDQDDDELYCNPYDAWSQRKRRWRIK